MQSLLDLIEPFLESRTTRVSQVRDEPSLDSWDAFIRRNVEEIEELSRAVKDPSFRIQVSEQGLHVYNREGMHVATDPFELFPHLGVEADGAHAFYLGVELARAQVAWQLGKRYRQDEPLEWGCIVPEELPSSVPRTPGSTLRKRN